MPPRSRLSPETALWQATDRISALVSTVIEARRPHLTGRRLDSPAVQAIVAGAVGELASAMAAQLQAVLAVGREVGVIDPELAS